MENNFKLMRTYTEPVSIDVKWYLCIVLNILYFLYF